MVELISKIIILDKKNTCIRLADTEWEAFDLICEKENIKRNDLIGLINNYKNEAFGLTYSLRLFIITYLHQHFLNKENPDYTNKKEKTLPVFNAIRGIF